MAVINGDAGGTPTNDNLTGTADADVINGLAGNDVINGLGGNDTIQGGAGNDTMDGGTGADLLIGGTGDDTYIVDQQGDQVIENTGEGNDLVQTTVSYILAGAQSVETLQAIGSDAVNLTGNELAQRLTGNTNANILDGGVNTNGATVGDTLVGGLGSDTYLVRNAADVVLENAGQGTDIVFVAPTAGNYALAAGQEIETLSVADQSSTYAVNLTGNEFAQTIIGNQGANVLTDWTPVAGTTAASHVLIGLGGNDTYNVNIAGTQVIEAANGGTDVVNTIVSFNAGTQSIETIDGRGLAAGTGTGGLVGLTLTGGASDQTIYGSNFADIINGGGGNDTLIGGTGNDTYVIDGGDTVTEAAGSTGGALDTVITSAPITLGAGVGIERLFATGSVRFTQAGAANSAFSINSYAFDTVDGSRNLNSENTSTTSVPFLNGNETAQVIVGNASDNILDGNRNADGNTNTGAAFADTLMGLAGNDTYRVYAQNDVVLEDRDSGRDTVFTSATYSLLTNDTNAQTVLTGALFGNAASGTFYTVGQIEVLSTASNSATTAINLEGNSYGNIVVGNYGNNVIIGGGTSAGGGTDVLIGLLGNDVYQVDSINSVVFEDAGQGTDAVWVSAAASGFTLNTNSSVEEIRAGTVNVLTGATTVATTGVAIVGNELAQAIYGGDGADTLAGGGGNDTLAGGLGNDTYRIADVNTVITENAGEGSDSVFTVGLSYRLANALSIEYLSTTAQGSSEAITLTGNQLAQTIVGNYGDNVLDSGQGAVTDSGIYNQAGDTSVGDTLVGLFGNDTYRVYSQNDVVTEAAGQGTDIISTSGDYSLAANNGTAASGTTAATGNGGVQQSVEVLRVDSSVLSTASVNLTGDDQANTLIGHAGQNVLDGGLGNDTLTGGAGADKFQFSTTLGSNNVDTITDFTAGDLIQVSRAVFATTAGGGYGTSGAISADNFVVGSAAQDANDYFVYNQSTGQLFFDADGSGAGAAVLFAQLTAGTALGFNSIVTIA